MTDIYIHICKYVYDNDDDLVKIRKVDGDGDDNKLASLEATLVGNYDLPTDRGEM